ncbi:MAG: FHA domain-containing protein [Myxococcales bacterium]|nr:FHA domain-containing protein [Myxococcales bacterium]MCB9577548.1 FHA domain-containing protein [Polyangiaceae bacterium]
MAPKDLNKTTLGGGTAAAGPHYAVRHGNRTIPLPLGETLVGRGTDCQIVLDSPLVSRRHAKIIVTPVGVMVEDLGSINGVKIDSRPLKGRIEVDVGTRVSVADEMLEVVRLGEDRPATAPEVKKAVTVQVRVEPESDEVSVTARRKDAFSLLARVVDKALALGRGDEAERLMTSMLEGALSEAEAGLKLPSGLAEDAARYAIRIALATKKPSWVDYAIRLFHTLGRPLPLDVVEEAHAVVGKLAIDRTLLRKYAADLDQKATSPTDRFAVRRIQSLADAAARAR